MKECRVGYELYLGKGHSIGLEYGQRLSPSKAPIYYNLLGTHRNTYLGGDSYTGFLNYKYYLSEEDEGLYNGLFVELKLMMRYTEYHDKVYSERYSKYGRSASLSSGYDNVYGATFLVGYRFSLFNSRHLFCEGFAGGSLRRTDSHTQFKSKCQSQYSGCSESQLIATKDDAAPFIDDLRYSFTLQLGAKFGVSF